MSEKSGFSCAKGLVLGLAAVAIGVATLIGWALDIPVLKSVIPSMVSMKPNTAIGIILAGLSLALLTCASLRGWGLVLSRLCAVAAGVLGGIALCESICGFHLGIDQVLFREAPDAVSTLSPARMAPITALSFVCLSAALVLASLGRALHVVQTLAVAAAILGLLGLSARLCGAVDLVGIGAGTQMALHTAIAFLVLGGGLLWLQPETGVMRTVRDSSGGSWLLKRLAPVAVAVPLLMGWLHVAGERRGYYSDPLGVALVTTALSAVLVGLLWWAARALNRADDAVREHQLQLHQFVEHSPAAIAMFDRDMKYILASRRWLTDYRIDGPVLGRSHYEVFPELPERLKEVHRRCLNGATQRGNDDPFPRADGTTDWIRWEARPWHTSQGDIGGIIILSEIITERRKAEEALREVHGLLNDVGKIAKIGGWRMNLATGKATWTQGAYDIAELAPGDPVPGVGEHVEYYLPQYRPRIAEAMRALIEEDKPLDFEAELRTAKGNIKFCRAVGRSVRVGGKAVEVYGTFQDITERKRAEAALRASDARYRSLFENMVEGFAYCRVLFEDDRPQDFVYIEVNEAFGTLTGLKDVVGRKVSDVIPGIRESDPELIERYGRVARTGRPERFETHLAALDMWFSVSVYSPAQDHFVAVFDVITARKRAEAERAEMAQQRQLALDAARLGWWHYDPATKIAKWDDRYKEIFGVSADSRPDGEVLKRLHPEDLPRVQAAVEAALDPRTPVPYSAEYRIILPNGDVRWIAAHGVAEFAGEGEARRAKEMVGTVEDITERKQIEQEREITINLLRLLTARNDVHGLIREVTTLMQAWSGCEAVGIRLRDGDDFPYFETRGFPAEFVEAERHLCLRDETGAPARDESGQVVLECMCGNILRGRFDPGLPFFTRDGSFWSNCTTALLASTTEQERHAHTRNRCNSAGYESVALVPLRFGNETFGLLQLNDHRSNMFTLDRIRLFERLAASIAVGISQRVAATGLAASERKYRLLAENVSDVLWVLNVDRQQWEYISPSVERLLGYTVNEVKGRSWETMLTPVSLSKARERMVLRLDWLKKRPGEMHSYVDEIEQIRKDGTTVWTEVATRYGRSETGEIVVTGVSRDIAERKRAEQTLRDAETRYRLLFEQSPVGVVILDPATARPIEFNEMAHRQLGYTREEFARLSLAEIDASETPEETRARISNVLREGRKDFETLHRTKTGDIRNVHVTAMTTQIAGRTVYHCLWRDITDQRKSEARRHELEAQLQQAQKMESVGRLAGGVAHDFNNILTGIGGYTELAMERLEERQAAREDMAEVQRLAKRAADLTRQLLAFSRRQPLEPVVLNLNETLADTARMLKRVLGENVDLQFIHAPSLGNVRADPGQVEQILMNLAVNSRDAMPEGGKLTIETANVDLDAEYASRHVGVTPGSYVMLAVSDTGHGMDDATKSRLFEPFFTTKEKGKGTGLGLATVYGIVKQHGGTIWVYSEPGKGATFKIYLPRIAEAVTVPAPQPASNGLQGRETILLVEDEASVRGFAERTLAARGYRVLGASDAEQALRIFQAHANEISLLLTDVVLPGMNGRKLYEHLKTLAPGLKVIYTSGYTDNAIVHHGVLDADTVFIQKPFTAEGLARRVRQVLDI